MDPTDGAPASQPTTAYLPFDARNLYVGWICKDDPAQVRARIAKRKDIESDDRVTIKWHRQGAKGCSDDYQRSRGPRSSPASHSR